MRLIFVRHAEPDYVHDSLTEKGFKEAEILVNRTKNWRPDEVYCSPMGRAQRTMEPSLHNWDKEGVYPKEKAVTYEWLQEFHYRIEDPQVGGERIAWDLMPEYFCASDELHNKDKWDKTSFMQYGEIEKHYNEVKEGLNTLLKEHGYVNRGDGFFNVEKHSDDTLVFFCHFGITSVIVGYLLGIAAPALWQGFFMAPTAVTVLNSEEREENKAAFRVQMFGDASHLPANNENISQSGYFAEMFQG